MHQLPQFVKDEALLIASDALWRKITLPWFDRDCSPNRASKKHWRPHHEAKKKQKANASELALELPRVKCQGVSIPIVAVFYPPTSGNDVDNCLASIKAALDGISKRLGVDDKFFKPIPFMGDKVQQGCIDLYFYYDEI